MPDLYLHPDGDALLVDSQGKLTADPACCCGATVPYNALVLELVKQTISGAFVPAGWFTDRHFAAFIIDAWTQERQADAAVFLDMHPVFPDTRCRYDTASPACHVQDGARRDPFWIFDKFWLDTYFPVGPRVFSARIGINEVPKIAYVAAHIYTGQFDPATRLVTGLQTLACIENPTPVQISPTQVAYEFPFTRP
jgi:hypothetical protein